ncbi:MAG: ATP phosphoribosyltransferase regulatory subunit, partial [Gammaproteobacteria bacterium]|nr:ATP phosphoribosyltransferase regulatory subunit [Gammaproteobacteria bacterium]
MIQAIRGMNDLLPPQTAHWAHVEERVRTLLTACGYAEIRLPLVEFTE